MFFIPSISFGQTLKKMTPEVYGIWNKIKNVHLSDSSEVIVYSLEKEIGDKRLAIYSKTLDATHYFDRMNKFAVEASGKHVIFTVGLNYDSLRTLKRKKTKLNLFPKDSLVIYNVAKNMTETISDIEDFKMPEKYSDYVFYTKKLSNVPTTSKDTINNDTTNIADQTVKDKKNGSSECKSMALIIRKLDTGLEDTLYNIMDYIFATESPKLAYCQCTGDTISNYSVWLMDLENGRKVEVYNNLKNVKQLGFNKRGSHLAFLGLKTKSEAVQKPYQIFLKTENDSIAIDLTDQIYEAKPKDWVISEHKPLTWSENGNRMFFGVSPILPVKDTTLLEDEIVNVEIWHYDAPRLFTQQESTLEADRKKSYAMMYDIDRKTTLLLETPEADKTILSKKGDGKYFLQLKSLPYQKEITWLGETRKDFILINTETKENTLILTGEYGNPSFSPGGRYIYWWSRNDSIWKTFNTETSILGTLGLWSVTTFHDEEDDVPQNASPYGIAGWLKDDHAAIVYDRYDLWKIDPTNPFSYEQWTDGRPKQYVHRWINTNPEIDFIDNTEMLLIHGFDEKTKATNYLHFDCQTKESKILTGGDHHLTTNVKKAKKTNDIVYTMENFEIFPDLIWTNDYFATNKKISSANPQQKEYSWGKAELFSWINYRNQKNDGMLFFPPNFDPEKKYPLIVNFYERSSNDLHRHRAPEAHRSTINYSYYTNQGYIIFNPDIKYLTGQPGDDCVNAVESGVDALVKTGFVDETRIGLQGHSWGGYQVAYLLTKSERYKCAESGAPVVNMVSAYGGIRWESGMSRMFQYEKTQSRLGATLWENPKIFHKNSPIYEMTNVTTPVLILHNDEDGAVPWYQGIEYYMALRRLNKPCWLLNYNNEPHWPVKWQNRLDFNVRMEQFFNYYLMDGTMPLWMKEGNSPLEKGIFNKY